jgi:16S rRNA A1518/A1519 N6-dimethyltransferase RsmA/KsgA/DIM1 with predicted DNA glycosylase/AP lyase activity
MDEEELELTRQCHPGSIKMFEEMMKKLPNMKYDRVLEVASGEGILTQDFLSK